MRGGPPNLPVYRLSSSVFAGDTQRSGLSRFCYTYKLLSSMCASSEKHDHHVRRAWESPPFLILSRRNRFCLTRNKDTKTQKNTIVSVAMLFSGVCFATLSLAAVESVCVVRKTRSFRQHIPPCLVLSRRNRFFLTPSQHT